MRRAVQVERWTLCNLIVQRVQRRKLTDPVYVRPVISPGCSPVIRPVRKPPFAALFNFLYLIVLQSATITSSQDKKGLSVLSCSFSRIEGFTTIWGWTIGVEGQPTGTGADIRQFAVSGSGRVKNRRCSHSDARPNPIAETP